MKTKLTATVSAVALLLSFATATVTLTGCTSTRTTRSTGESIDDAAITGKVKAAMVKDPAVSALQVNVETYRGRVQLNGFVDTAQQKERAAQLAKGVEGVLSVDNNLVVKK